MLKAVSFFFLFVFAVIAYDGEKRFLYHDPESKFSSYFEFCFAIYSQKGHKQFMTDNGTMFYFLPNDYSEIDIKNGRWVH